ncbi:hypothetical protein CROQUDRAFT_85315, partial [Cronartium quercuum f. sp. fusiforme G11]
MVLDLSQKRSKAEVLFQAEMWAKAKTVTQKDKLVTNYGVRDSELNQLDYRDPVDHVVLGVMHNWLEGILQNHFRNWWGFQGKKKNRQRDYGVDDDHDEESEFEMDTDEDKNMTWIEDFDFPQESTEFLFSANDRLQLLSLLRDVIIPSGIETIPHNLGEASHGKLKAAQWASLFLYYIPLVISEILVPDVEDFCINSNRSMIMENTSSLVQCTQIVLSKAVTKASIDQFELMYSRYIESSKNIFKVKSFRPNHHYALHIPEMMSYWGPLLGVSEFAGERLIGMLQKVTVNNKNDQMDATKIGRFCQVQRLYAQFD